MSAGPEEESARSFCPTIWHSRFLSLLYLCLKSLPLSSPTCTWPNFPILVRIPVVLELDPLWPTYTGFQSVKIKFPNKVISNFQVVQGMLFNPVWHINELFPTTWELVFELTQYPTKLEWKKALNSSKVSLSFFIHESPLHLPHSDLYSTMMKPKPGYSCYPLDEDIHVTVPWTTVSTTSL